MVDLHGPAGARLGVARPAGARAHLPPHRRPAGRVPAARRAGRSAPGRDRQAPTVPAALVVAAAWSWRLLVVGALGYVLLTFLSGLTLLIVPVFLSLLLAALLHRPTELLRGFLPRWVAALLVLLAALVVLGAVGWFVALRIEDQYGNLVAQANDLVARLQVLSDRLGWLRSGSTTLLDRATAWLQAHDTLVVSSALTAGRVVADGVTTLVLTFFLTLFFLIDGDRMWSWLVRLLPATARPAANGAGHRAFATLSGWVTGTAIIALIHAVVIGLALWLLGTPLVVVLAVLVFLGSFLPIIGAFLFGGLAVLMTLVTVGLGPAVILLVVLVVEDLLEGHVYQPLIMGRTVRLHPVAVLIALTAGSVLAGILGAIVAIPVAAAVHAAVKYLTGIEDIDGNPLRTEDRMRPEPPPRAVGPRGVPKPP
jgi:putative heme transporter